MAGTHENWLRNGIDLNLFSNIEEEVRYILAWMKNDNIEVSELLFKILQKKNFNLDILNHLAHPDEYNTATFSLDCPISISYIKEKQFNLISHGGTTLPPKYFIKEDGTLIEEIKNLLLTEITNFFLLLDNSSKKTIINNLIEEAFFPLSNSSSLSELVRSIIIIYFLKDLSDNYIDFRKINKKFDIVVSSLNILENRLKFAGLSWISLYGLESKLVTFEKIRRATSIVELDLLLEKLETDNTKNLIQYLRCLPL